MRQKIAYKANDADNPACVNRGNKILKIRLVVQFAMVAIAPPTSLNFAEQNL